VLDKNVEENEDKEVVDKEDDNMKDVNEEDDRYTIWRI